METITAAAVATLLITKMVEKLGESVGEKIPEIGSHIWEQITQLKRLLNIREPETLALLEAAENAPTLTNTQPDVFGLPILTARVERIAEKEPEISAVINTIASEVTSTLSVESQKKVIQQVVLKDIVGKSLEVKKLTQEADVLADKVEQEMLINTRIENDINLSDITQKA